ncbi:pirin family protein [Legionella brunensis]|uniref:Pirin-like protein n=1 Tax=Legionella brunensis TaxID=29422 RepID=A0A0W0STV3_9GAMM|nr:pirin family protein [Legionella brunensis]KTC86784.1 pirin-like protein [Legionella brunensis]
MILVRQGSSRGKSEFYWLNSFHTFSFGDYFDPDFMGFGSLRVINEDTVQPGQGFGRHPHKDMEIISYVIEGSLQHKDSMGTGTIITPGEIQCMSAGTGVEHSEFNPSATEIVHFLQIWIIPETKGLTPTYQQQSIPQLNNKLTLIASKEGREVIKINQDVKLYRAFLTPEHLLKHEFEQKRGGWLQVIKGELNLNGQMLTTGDGAAIITNNIEVKSIKNTEFLLFDICMMDRGQRLK